MTHRRGNQFDVPARVMAAMGSGLFTDTPTLRGIGFLLEGPDNVDRMAKQINERQKI